MMKLDRILVPVDFSAGSRCALAWAVDVAAQFGSAVEVLHAWRAAADTQAMLPTTVYDQIEIDAKKAMEAFIKSAEIPNTVDVTTRVQYSSAVPLITQLSSEFDMIVMGTHGRTGFKRIMLGSVAERVVRLAECPVLTVRADADQLEKTEAPHEEQVVHAMFDNSESVEKAFDMVRELGVPVDKISLVMTEDTHDRDFKDLDKTKALRGATAGSIVGGSIGGILGGLASIGTVVTGGLGLVIMGPALAFAAAGGLFGGLLGRSVKDDKAAILKAQLNEGKMLMAVHFTDPALASKIDAVIKQLNGESLDD